LFGAFPVEEAGRVMSAIFPAYYRLGAACGVALVAAALWLWRSGAGGRHALAACLAALMLAAVIYAGFVLQPRVGELRTLRHRPDAPAEMESEFQRLHRLSVQLNAVVLAGGLALSVLAVRSRARP
jgi:hypothetical protein